MVLAINKWLKQYRFMKNETWNQLNKKITSALISLLCQLTSSHLPPQSWTQQCEPKNNWLRIVFVKDIHQKKKKKKKEKNFHHRNYFFWKNHVLEGDFFFFLNLN